MKKPNDGFIPGAVKDKKNITNDWVPLINLIQDVKVHEVKNVSRDVGVLTELYRKEWNLDNQDISHIFQTILTPNSISAWHMHEETTDRLFVNTGMIKIVLYDNRTKSKTNNFINEFIFGIYRPALIVIPTSIWHGVQNIGNENSSLINMADKSYDYENPDHWRLPSDTDKIPYRWQQ